MVLLWLYPPPCKDLERELILAPTPAHKFFLRVYSNELDKEKLLDDYRAALPHVKISKYFGEGWGKIAGTENKCALAIAAKMLMVGANPSEFEKYVCDHRIQYVDVEIANKPVWCHEAKLTSNVLQGDDMQLLNWMGNFGWIPYPLRKAYVDLPGNPKITIEEGRLQDTFRRSLWKLSIFEEYEDGWRRKIEESDHDLSKRVFPIKNGRY